MMALDPINTAISSLDNPILFLYSSPAWRVNDRKPNAKMMRALSVDGQSLRYVLALGLRSLTLQAGDEYRNSFILPAILLRTFFR